MDHSHLEHLIYTGSRIREDAHGYYFTGSQMSAEDTLRRWTKDAFNQLLPQFGDVLDHMMLAAYDKQEGLWLKVVQYAYRFQTQPPLVHLHCEDVFGNQREFGVITLGKMAPSSYDDRLLMLWAHLYQIERTESGTPYSREARWDNCVMSRDALEAAFPGAYLRYQTAATLDVDELTLTHCVFDTVKPTTMVSLEGVSF